MLSGFQARKQRRPQATRAACPPLRVKDIFCLPPTHPAFFTQQAAQLWKQRHRIWHRSRLKEQESILRFRRIRSENSSGISSFSSRSLVLCLVLSIDLITPLSTVLSCLVLSIHLIHRGNEFRNSVPVRALGVWVFGRTQGYSRTPKCRSPRRTRIPGFQLPCPAVHGHRALVPM